MAVVGVASGVLGLLMWSDGDPDAPLAISALAGPIAVVLAAIALKRRARGRRATPGVALTLGALLTTFWLLLTWSLASGTH